MESGPSDLSRLSAADLERLVESHLDAAFAELHAAEGALRAKCSPARLALRHPVAAAAVAAGAGLLIARAMRAKVGAGSPGPAQRQSLGQGFARSLTNALGGAAARAVPAILATFLARRGHRHGERDA